MTRPLLLSLLLLPLLACGASTAPAPAPDDMRPDADMSAPPQDQPADADLSPDTPDDAPDTPADTPDDMSPSGPLEITILGEGTARFDERAYDYKLLRLRDGASGHTTYAQWVDPAPTAARPLPVLVMTQPYVGIDWTGEAVDQRWAALGQGLHPDADEPSFDPDTGSSIAYDPVTPEALVAQSQLYQINGIATLHIFGRFYAGGSIADDREDMVLGMRYLTQRDDIDPARIGVFGGSWGGFNALYATAYAPAEVRPSVVVALYALSDFAQEWRFTDSLAAITNPTLRDAYQTFFEPYRRRITATTGGAPDAPGASFDGFTHDALASLIPDTTTIFTFHDAHDTLVPFTMGQDLAARLGTRVKPVWFIPEAPLDLNTTPPDHGATAARLGSGVIILTSGALITRLRADNGPLLLATDTAQLNALLEHMHAQQTRGASIGALPGLLADLADPRVILVDLTNGTSQRGDEAIATAVNARWGTSFTPQDVAQNLRALDP